jgi:LemA protein
MVWIIIIVVVLILLYFLGVYNSLVDLKNKMKNSWAQIDVQLKRRFDLIPNLVETVKGYAKHESETLEKVISARNSYLSAAPGNEQVKANNELTGALNKLFALAESYPDLKANTNFLDMQSNLKDTEDKISYSRQFFNDSVLTYNNKVQMFPSSIIAKLFGFKPGTFFEASEEARENVKVKF